MRHGPPTAGSQPLPAPLHPPGLPLPPPRTNDVRTHRLWCMVSRISAPYCVMVRIQFHDKLKRMSPAFASEIVLLPSTEDIEMKRVLWTSSEHINLETLGRDNLGFPISV